MGWVAVPAILEARDQMNRRFPDREKGAEGIIGDLAHQTSASSHNPDLTGRPEFRDGDSKDEVRAVDFDKDLRDPDGVTMEDVVQLWVSKAREGKMPWLRYLIYNKRIWHKNNNFAEKPYTGKDPHTSHVHVNNDFTEYADTVTGTNWFLDEVRPGWTPGPVKLDPKDHPTIKYGSEGKYVAYFQEFMRLVFPAYRFSVTYRRNELIDVDGDFGKQTQAWAKEFQRRVGIKQDGIVGPITLSHLRKYGYTY